MCGRFTQTRPWAELVELYRITEPLTARQPERRYNIAPTDDVAVVRTPQGGHGRELLSLRWGLLPVWADNPRMGARMINARAETIGTKPAFRTAFRSRRCLVIADGFYEWQICGSRAKQPYYIAAAEDQPLAFAGLWERWFGAGAEPVETCAIITAEATPALRGIHDRMPVILPWAAHDPWLDRDTAAKRLVDLLRPYPETLAVRPVPPRVNDVRRDDPGCIESVVCA